MNFKKKKIGGAVAPVESNSSLKSTVKLDKELDKEAAEEAAEEQKALEAAQELEEKIEKLKQEAEILKKTLAEDLQPKIDEIYTKYQTDTDTKIENLNEDELKQLTTYINTYKEYVTTLSKIAIAEDEQENQSGFFDTYVIEPIAVSFGKMMEGIKNGTAKLLTGTGKFWVELADKSINEMEPSLISIGEARARIAQIGKLDLSKDITANATADISNATADISNATADLSNATTTGLSNATQSLSTGLNNSTQGLNNTIQSLLTQGQRGGYSNIKAVQKGGIAAAKRTQKSIKQFLSSSVTSSQILNMIKRKTKAKRKKTRYTRKRAKK